MIRGVAFDLDHTLFDRYATLRAVAPDFYRDFRARLAPGITEADVSRLIQWADRAFIHFEWEILFGELLKTGLFADPPTWEEYRDYLRGKFAEIAVPFPFARPTLAALRADGYKLGLITNGGEALQRAKLRMLQMENDFDAVLITGAFGTDKPDPAPFAAMAAQLALPPAELLYVGDNPFNDVEGARRAGYTPVWIRTTGSWVAPELPQPALQADTVAELPAMLRALNGGAANT